MLCIVYASKARQSDGARVAYNPVEEILSIARQNNAKTTITSALVYRGGEYLQLIEGSSRDVDQLYRIICQDKRHDHVEKLIDIPIKERAFPGNDIKLILNLQEDTRFINFIAENKEIFKSSNTHAGEKLAHFGCAKFEDLTPFYSDKNKPAFVDKMFKLKRAVEIDWLEAEMLDPEKAIAGMQLSEILAQNYYSYQELLQISNLNAEQSLIDILNTLYATGNLSIADKPETLPTKRQEGAQGNHRKDKKSFRQKLLNWLVMH